MVDTGQDSDGKGTFAGMGDVKHLSERVSYKKHGDYTTIVISPRLEQGKQLLLTFWVFSWTFCGLYVMYEFFMGNYERELRLMLFVFLCFWAYYEYRIGYVWIWRRKGMELIKIEDGIFSYKRSIRTYGKVYQFHLDNIRDFGKADKKASFTGVISNSFWVMGDESLRFEYQGREFRFGVQLNEEETDKLRKFILTAMQEEIRRMKLSGLN